MSGLRWKVGSVAALVLLLSYLAVANFVPEETRASSALLPDEGLRLGLDLQGGIHWVLSPKLDVAIRQELEHLRERLATDLREEGVEPERLAVEDRRIVVETGSPGALESARTAARDTDVLRVVSSGDGRLELALDADWADQVRERGMSQVLEVLRRRIADPVRGIQDTVVTRQGRDRVLVQIPGGQVTQESAEKLLRQTGFLEFKMIRDQAPSEDLLRAKYPDGLPEGTEIVPERDRETQRVINVYLVPRAPDVTGEYLADARVGFDQQQRPIVNFAFNSRGADIFSELTRKNIGEPLGIILDGELYSAPVIRSQIAARGQIEGQFTAQEAADLAVVLRAGSLPIPVQIEENRTIGPALGADSIRRGTYASILGLVLIVIFTVFYYRLSGIFASVSLLANLLLILGVMSAFGATLTMPGIAGLVLTVGMAIDANVIIFERIREELRTGKMPSAAIDAGFSKALWTVLDANLTTLFTAIVLYEYGTGPVKGFAVTLSIGIATSVFAAMILTRLMFAVLTSRRRLQALSI